MSHKWVIKGSHVRRRGLPVRGRAGAQRAGHAGRLQPGTRADRGAEPRPRERGPRRRPLRPGRYADVALALPPPSPTSREPRAGTRPRVPGPCAGDGGGGGGGAHVAAERPAEGRCLRDLTGDLGCDPAGQGTGRGECRRCGTPLLRKVPVVGRGGACDMALD